MARYEFCLSLGYETVLASDFRTEPEKWWPLPDHQCPDVQLRLAGYGMGVADVKIGGVRFDALVEQTVGHGGVQQRSGDPSVQYAIVALEPCLRFEVAGDRPVLAECERQP